MVPFFVDLLSFFLKTLIVILVVSIPVGLVFAAVLKSKGKKNPSTYADSKLIIRDLKSVYEKRKKSMVKALSVYDPDKKIASLDEKKKKKKDKKEDKDLKIKDRQSFIENLKKLEDEGVFCPQNLYVVNFVGSTKGNEVKKLRKEIDAILDVATPKDEVIVNLTSPGGMVNSYGLCASQLARIRDRGIKLTCTVDSVAASGGYLMASVADHIVAAPFSYIGSIGVIAGIPNFRKVLDKYDVEYEQITAGKYKRTLSMLGENTQEGRKKFKEELEAIHARFKEQVQKYRPFINIDEVATGEYWLASDALKLKLVDEIATSDEYISKKVAQTYGCALQIMCARKQKRSLLSKLKQLILLKHIKSDIGKLLLSAKDDEFTGIR
ncbi:protease SohB [Succinatimonas hippei]|uniref:Putative signal peptide peptidase SppA, 36K type n=1 Tax=Succinatimonas hippei (strain DSM 22608 / JCM 16073 / KCTC 15190 / YIT 12066) TaxID=762983 RepID=E8LMW7_SUCHY|nr:protease SohB [Succinatimonas hippei]EFY06143.1 putative signal peptide peptidase SppA, 36K type [Succinatimonas hippei YIT 12066]